MSMLEWNASGLLMITSHISNPPYTYQACFLVYGLSFICHPQIISMEDDKLLELNVSLLSGGRSPLDTADPAKPQGSVRLRVGRLHLLLLHKVLAEMQVRGSLLIRCTFAFELRSSTETKHRL